MPLRPFRFRRPTGLQLRVLAPLRSAAGVPQFVLATLILLQGARVEARFSLFKPRRESTSPKVTAPAPALAPAKTRLPSLVPRAILPDGRRVGPDNHGGGYYGCSSRRVQDPGRVARTGFPVRGDDWRLLEHAEQRGNSAFRGTTQIVSDPVTGNGAAYWDREGGWVFEIRGVPTWNINSQLGGRVETPGGFRGNTMHGEQENAIVSKVPPEKIKRYGRVVEDSMGRLLVREWTQNPTYEGLRREAK